MKKALRTVAAAGILAVLLAALAGCVADSPAAGGTDAAFPTIDRWWK